MSISNLELNNFEAPLEPHERYSKIVVFPRPGNKTMRWSLSSARMLHPNFALFILLCAHLGYSLLESIPALRQRWLSTYHRSNAL